jgi:hypothetical protein
MKLGYRTKPYNYENCKEAEEQAKEWEALPGEKIPTLDETNYDEVMSILLEE